MKKVLRPQLILALAIALVICFGWFAMAKAQGNLTYISSVQVINNGTAKANIILTFYDPVGNSTTVTDTIELNSSKSYFPLPITANFRGSLVISSDQPISAMTNLSSTDMKYGDATNAFSSGATAYKLPLIMCNNSNYNTFFNVQNAGTTDAHVKVRFQPGLDKNGIAMGAVVTDTATIKSGAAESFDQAGTVHANCNTPVTVEGNLLPALKGTYGKFLGNAYITSDVPIVATVMELNVVTTKQLLGYNGFADGFTAMSAPLLMSNNSQYYSTLNIANAGTTPTTVTVTYSVNTVVGSSFQPAADTCKLAVGGSCNIFQHVNADAKWATKWIGNAVLTTDGGKIVTVVNLIRQNTSDPKGSAYSALDLASASANVSLPLIMSNNNTFYTTIQVQNAGNSDCAAVNITYGPNLAAGTFTGTVTPAAESFPLAQGATWVVFQAGTPPGNGSVNTWPTGKDASNRWIRYLGSAEVSAPGCKILALVNEQSSNLGDNLYTFTGFNH